MSDALREFHKRHAPKRRIPEWLVGAFIWLVLGGLALWGVLSR